MALGLGLYFLSLLAIRLHITQMAYQFTDLKSYERSLIEEQRRLRVGISEKISALAGADQEFRDPRIEQVKVLVRP